MCFRNSDIGSSSRFSSLLTIWPQISPVSAEFVWLIRCLIIRSEREGKQEFLKKPGRCTSTYKLDPLFSSCSSLNNFQKLIWWNNNWSWSKVHASTRKKTSFFMLSIITMCVKLFLKEHNSASSLKAVQFYTIFCVKRLCWDSYTCGTIFLLKSNMVTDMSLNKLFRIQFCVILNVLFNKYQYR